MDPVPYSSGNYYHSVEVTNGNAILGNQYITVVSNQSSSLEARCSLFLASVRHTDMNSRKNTIQDTKYNTFEWIFQDDVSLEKDVPSLKEWLASGNDIYFVQGKAGSGKSTFMKFVFEHYKTRSLVRDWSQSSVLLFHAFWLAGSEYQKSYKGLLASLIHQIIEPNRSLFQQIAGSTGGKTCLSDWSVGELSRILSLLVHNQSLSYCIFIDGLDEHNDKDEHADIETILELIEEMVSLENVKLCVSSRPVSHILDWAADCKMLKLHQLTEQDILEYVTKTLASKAKARTRNTKFELDLEHLAREISQKANGVFIWVYYVMKNIVKGLRVQDDIKSLRKRIAGLPSEMSVLYKDMWEKQNSDHKIHKTESMDIFAYVNKGGTTLFKLAILFDPSLRKRYIRDVCPLDEAFLDEICRVAAKKIAVRCAGLLECVNGRLGASNNSVTWKGPKGTEEHQSVWWRNSITQFIHRTAYDFVKETGLTAEPKDQSHREQALLLNTEASLVCFVEEVFRFKDLADVMDEALFDLVDLSQVEVEVASKAIKVVDIVIQKVIRQRFECISETDPSLLLTRRRVQGLLKESHSTGILSNNSATICTDMMVCTTSWFTGSRWLPIYLQPHLSSMSSYYLGYLLLCAIDTAYITDEKDDDEERVLETVLLLMHAGADLKTPQCRKSHYFWSALSPGSALLSWVVHCLLIAGPLRAPTMCLLSQLLKASPDLPSTFSMLFINRKTLDMPNFQAILYHFDSLSDVKLLITFSTKHLLDVVTQCLEDEIGKGKDLENTDTDGNSDQLLTAFRERFHKIPRRVTLVDTDSQGYIHLNSSTQTTYAAWLLQECVRLHFTYNENEGKNKFLEIVGEEWNDRPWSSGEWDYRDVFTSALNDIMKETNMQSLTNLHEIDLTLPRAMTYSCIDPTEHITADNWEERGVMRRHFAELLAEYEDMEDEKDSQADDTSDLDRSGWLVDGEPVQDPALIPEPVRTISRRRARATDRKYFESRFVDECLSYQSESREFVCESSVA